MRRPVGFFLLAGFAAVLAALVVYAALKKREAELQRAMVKSVEIVVAAQNLPLGAKIDAGSVKLARWSRDALPLGSFDNAQAVIGTYVKNSFVMNEPIVASKLFIGEKTAGVMPLLIPPGMRAMSVSVDEVSDIAGFVLPHSRVDVLVAISGENSGRNASGSSGSRSFSKAVLQNVEVLAVAQEIEGKKDEPQVVKVVTLLVTLEEAERLALASREGTLRLAMRNYSDSKIVLTRGSDVDDMLRAYSSRVETPAISSQAGFPRPLKIQRPQVRVEILRNGRSAESLSFIDLSLNSTDSEPRPRRLMNPAARSPGNSETIASAASKDSSASAMSPKVTSAAAGILPVLPGAATASAPAAAGSKPEAALLPHSKTIFLP